MKLNKKNSGLPAWPDIRRDEKSGWIEVSGKHVSYRRYLAAQWLLRLVLILPWILAFVIFTDDSSLGIEVAVGLGIPYLILFAIIQILPMPGIIARLFFPRFTRVRFTREAIWIDGKAYDAPANMDIQFRAQRPALPKHKFNRIAGLYQAERAAKHESEKLKFRAIEMVYGHQLVPLTTVADEDRAAQFAIALQVSLNLAKSQAAANSAPPKETARKREFDDALPE
jgi:hypothetical protein